MLSPVQITPEEKGLLEDWRRYGTSPLIRDRALAMIVNSQGKSAHFISGILSRKEETIRSWLQAFTRRRLSSLFSRYQQNNNAGKLTPEQKQEVQHVLSQSPSDYGIPTQFWQVKDLKRWIKAEFGVVYESDRSYHFLFQLGRFSWKLPDQFDAKRNDRVVNARLADIRTEIAPFLANDQWVVLASDETRLMWESESRRAWLRTNQKTILRVHRSHEYQSFLGSLNLKTGHCHLHALSWQNHEQIVKALKKLTRQYPGKNICIVWDNAPWHRGKLLRQELSRTGSLRNVHLIAFPPYAPDTNPQEHVWKHAKNWIAHRPTTSFKQKINNFKLAVISRKFFYTI